MIAILGSELDSAAHELVNAWSDEGAVLISARDLCTRGWVFSTPWDEGGSYVAGGVAHRTAELKGVLVRRPAMAAEELPWIARADRQYVAAEINAFLVAWLAALPCVVLNRPTATSLCGPAWSQTQWKVMAARAGVRWSDNSDQSVGLDAVFCQKLRYRAVTNEQALVGKRLAQISGADLLGIRLAGDAVNAVTLQPKLTEKPVRDMVLSCLTAEVAA